MGRTTREIKTYPLDAILDRTIPWPGLQELKKSRSMSRGVKPIAKAMRSLTLRRANILLVAVLQKKGSDAFRNPIQGMYGGENISSETIAAQYSEADA